MECEDWEVSESWGLVGGIVAGGGACPYKAPAAVRCTQYPLGRAQVKRYGVKEENGRKAFGCVAMRGRCLRVGMDNAEVQSLRKQKAWGRGKEEPTQ